MDSITQMALGAAVGEALLGRRLGYRAALYGAAIGTLPDLDVLVPLGDPVADFTYHRSASHSLIVLTLLAPGLAWLLHRIPRRDNPPFRAWWALTFGALVTHPLLDAFTVYGTQLLWPLPFAPTSISSVFIIDPAYTLPLIIGLGATAWLARRATLRPRWPNAVGLALSTLYLGWGLGAKEVIDADVERSLAEQGLAGAPFLTTPAPFTTLLWRVVAMDTEGDRYLEGFASVVDGSPAVSFQSYGTSPALLEDLTGDWRVQRLSWFTHGFYAVSQEGEDVYLTDLRMGTEPGYIFNFRLGVRPPNALLTAPAPTLQAARPFDLARLALLFDRITDPSVDLRAPGVLSPRPSAP